MIILSSFLLSDIIGLWSATMVYLMEQNCVQAEKLIPVHVDYQPNTR